VDVFLGHSVDVVDVMGFIIFQFLLLTVAQWFRQWIHLVPAETCVSHWCWQEECLAKIAAVIAK